MFGLGQILGIGSSVIGGVLGAKSQRKAAKRASQMADKNRIENNALAAGVYQNSTNALTPYMQQGNPAGTQINAMLGLGGEPAQTAGFDNFRNSSGYQFARDEALSGVNSNYAARGVLQSGAAMRAMQDRAGQVATQNTFLPYMQLLDNQQRLGLSATMGQAGLGQSYVGTVTGNNSMATQDMANAALVRGQNNPWATALSGMGGMISSGGLKF